MAVQINLESYARPWRPGIYPKSTTVIYNNQLWILNDTITGLFSSSDFLAEVANGDWIGRYVTESEIPMISTLLKEEFIFSGSQTFTLANNYAQVYSVEVQGQGNLSTSQYTLVAPNQITINDTLDTGDYVVILYSEEIAGVAPYYTQSQTDSAFIATIPKFIYVRNINDFPNAVSGVRTLLPDTTYFITDTIDLNGDRLVGSSNTTILGASSENSILTSTGLGVGVPLLSSIYTTPIRHIAINDVDTAVNFDGTSNPSDMALDWTGVNFVNVPNVGTIKKASNFIFDKGAFLNSKGISFDGTIGTLAFGNCLFNGDGLLGNILKIESTCSITRRFRIIYSSIIAFGSTTGINVSVSATIPNEGYILDTVNFSGGGTYLSGVIDNGDNKTLFDKCRGIINTNPNSQYYMNGNLTTTVVGSIGVPVKILGTTSNSSLTQKFTDTNNRATYIGAISQVFKVVATLSVESGNNNQIGCYIAKNGTILPESEVYGTTSGAGRAENIVIQTKVNLSTNDYIEIFVENETALNNILVTDLNVIVD